MRKVFLHSGRATYGVHSDDCGSLRTLEDMPQICEQSIRNINCAVGKADQSLSQRNAWHRSVQRCQAFLEVIRCQRDALLQMREREGSIAKMAGYPDIITRPGAASTQCFPFTHLANHRHTDIER